MAIDKLQEVALAFPHGEEGKVLDCLYDRAILHVVDVPGSTPEQTEASATPADQRKRRLDDIEGQLQLVEKALTFLNGVEPRTKSLVESFFPDEIYVDRQTLLQEVKSIDSHPYDTFALACTALDAQILQKKELAASLKNEMNALSKWSACTADMDVLRRLRRVKVVLGSFRPTEYAKFLAYAGAQKLAVREEQISSSPTEVCVAIAVPIFCSDSVAGVLSEHGFTEVDLGLPHGSPASQMALLTKQWHESCADLNALEATAHEYAARRDELITYRECLKSQKECLETDASKLYRSRHRSVLTGYVRDADLKDLHSACNGLSDVVCVTGKVENADAAPVSISNNRWIKPLEIFSNMFGYPVYSSFDPTLALAIPSMLFFGLCLGDVLYGLVQILLCLYFIHKHPRSEGVRNFMMVFLYGGLASMVCGALTGSWGGDLISATYLGAGNPLVRFVEAVKVIDPLQSAFKFLILVWGIGVLSQLYGVVLAMVKNIRRRAYASALFDCVGWLIFLPAIIGLIFGGSLGAAFKRYDLIAIGIGGVLLLIGGYRSSGPVGAIVNLYGIQSSYGVGSFVGDVLSYSRLMALGLTTSILGSAFNLIASLIKAPGIGIVMCAVVLLLGHSINYFLGTMGAFIHTTRLILLEWFGRFYEAGAARFRPLGFRSEIVKIISGSSVKQD